MTKVEITLAALLAMAAVFAALLWTGVVGVGATTYYKFVHEPVIVKGCPHPKSCLVQRRDRPGFHVWLIKHK